MIKPISYMQTDPKWKNYDYSAKGEKTTIGASGCGPSCMAMVISTLRDGLVTPAVTCAWALKKGYKAPKQGTYYSYFKPQGKEYGLEVTQLNSSSVYGKPDAEVHKTALAKLKAGHWVIACMGRGNWTTSGHFILCYGMDGSNVLIRDPNSTKSSRTKAAHATFKNQVKYYFLVEVNTAPSDSLKYEWANAVAEGITDGSFPGKYVTREQAAAMIYRAVEHNTAGISEAWEWAKYNGVTDGSRPKDNCTRQEAVTLLHRAVHGDITPIQAWEKAILNKLTDGSKPKNPCSREQLIAFIVRSDV